MASRRAARIAGANRHPIGRQIGEARSKTRIDIFVENLGGRLDMRIGIEYAQPVFHPALPYIVTASIHPAFAVGNGRTAKHRKVYRTNRRGMRQGHAAVARKNARPRPADRVTLAYPPRARKAGTMPRVTYIDTAGKETVLGIDVGTRVMQAATLHGVDGIVAECGGSCMCATCHVYVREDQLAKTPAMGPDEDAMLEGTASERKPNSRLSCQLVVSPEMDGLVVYLPETQT